MTAAPTEARAPTTPIHEGAAPNPGIPLLRSAPRLTTGERETRNMVHMMDEILTDIAAATEEHPFGKGIMIGCATDPNGNVGGAWGDWRLATARGGKAFGDAGVPDFGRGPTGIAIVGRGATPQLGTALRGKEGASHVDVEIAGENRDDVVGGQVAILRIRWDAPGRAPVTIKVECAREAGLHRPGRTEALHVVNALRNAGLALLALRATRGTTMALAVDPPHVREAHRMLGRIARIVETDPATMGGDHFRRLAFDLDCDAPGGRTDLLDASLPRRLLDMSAPDNAARAHPTVRIIRGRAPGAGPSVPYIRVDPETQAEVRRRLPAAWEVERSGGNAFALRPLTFKPALVDRTDDPIETLRILDLLGFASVPRIEAWDPDASDAMPGNPS